MSEEEGRDEMSEEHRPAGTGGEAAARADEADEDAGRREWTPPELEELPPLRDLTLLQGQSVGGTESVFS